MSVLDRFNIHQPQSVAEASAMLADFGSDAAVYAGGTELLIVMKERLAHFPHLVDIKRIPGLKEITFNAERRELTIGAVATHRDLERSPLVRERFPALSAMAAAVANIRVRNAGTIGGNLCFAEPHSDPATLLSALDARLTLVSTSGTRQLPMASFLTGLMETARHHDELLVTIAVPEPPSNAGVAYERFKLHERPTAAVAAVIEVADGVISDARVVVGSVGERPQRLPATEAVLRGQPAAAATATIAADVIRDEVETSGSVFESEAYTRQLARTVGRRAVAAAIQRVTGEEGGRRAA
ncbi:MAG TPA: FAD binding domain-containing protein [Thermomicrobiales bacterium]|nr:FAD binding domain-containing protein [Thermomicrobiales bacterium]